MEVVVAVVCVEVLRPTQQKQVIPETFFPANLLKDSTEDGCSSSSSPSSISDNNNHLQPLYTVSRKGYPPNHQRYFQQ